MYDMSYVILRIASVKPTSEVDVEVNTPSFRVFGHHHGSGSRIGGTTPLLVLILCLETCRRTTCTTGFHTLVTRGQRTALWCSTPKTPDSEASHDDATLGVSP